MVLFYNSFSFINLTPLFYTIHITHTTIFNIQYQVNKLFLINLCAITDNITFTLLRPTDKIMGEIPVKIFCYS